ncbi:kinase-like protein [Aspergillus aculeatinus CBS 121060]|uniref:Kinase-like protein n=1 Tax=Aspergillus aculeatinus CBS 121060 TaxID=1448322 RepID=A0ACD1H3T0_9EURO|nr:kinase-like protein [Aspergillus aculeatinus CBS 121060]RAH68124.1 kinase-like protein [Aspergillus aculeatinus CBS 121060]
MLTERSTVPCSACSFSPERQRCCNYESQVKIFYEAGDRGVWALGSDLILKDRGPSCPTDENANIRFVKKNTTIPVPTVIAHHQESDGHALTVMNRVPGESLSEAWSKLTDNQKENIAKQTAKYLLQLRSLQSDRVEGVDGRPVYDGWLYKEKGRHNAPCPPMMSDDEVWNGLAVHLDPAVPESARRQLRRYMPPTQPFTFTHNDLTHVNIMVQSGEVVAILDWERAGFFPVWWEYVCTMATHAGKEDFEWNKLLRKHMPEMDDAHDFFLYYYHLCIDLESDAAKTFIAMSEEYDSEKDESEEDESKEIGS